MTQPGFDFLMSVLFYVRDLVSGDWSQWRSVAKGDTMSDVEVSTRLDVGGEGNVDWLRSGGCGNE
jgi:hypothetical protein